jgi:hypothetical protein
MKFIVLKVKRLKGRYRLKEKMLNFKEALKQERTETIEMLVIYRNFTLRKASKEEMKIAHAQFFDLLKGTGLGIFAILPFAPITIPIVLKLGRMMGIELLPTSFAEKPDVKETHNSIEQDKDNQN